MVKASIGKFTRIGFVTAAVLLASCSEDPASAQRSDVQNSEISEESADIGGQDISNAELKEQHERLRIELSQMRGEIREAGTSGAGFMSWLMGLVGFALGIAVMGLLRLFRSGSSPTDSANKEQNRPSANQDASLGSLKEYQKVKFDKISKELVDIDMKITRLGKSSVPEPVRAAPVNAPSGASKISPPVQQASARTPAYETVDTSRPPEPLQKPVPAPIPAKMVQDISNAFNAINSPSSLADFESVYEPASFSNVRDQGIEQIFENDIARFWLVVDPADENRALLLPGADAIKNWAKYKDRTVDNPFGHHFALRQGEHLRIVQPALVVRSAEGWQLQSQGVLAGMQ